MVQSNPGPGACSALRQSSQRETARFTPRYGGCAFHVTAFGTLSPLAVPLSMAPAVRMSRVYRRSSGTDTILVEGLLMRWRAGSTEREDTDVPGWRHGKTSFRDLALKTLSRYPLPTSRVDGYLFSRSSVLAVHRRQSPTVAWATYTLLQRVACFTCDFNINTVCISVSRRVHSRPCREATCRGHSSRLRRLQSLRRSRSHPYHLPCRRPCRLPFLQRHSPGRNPPAKPLPD